MKVLCFMLSTYFPVDYISVDVSDRILALIFFVCDLSYSIILRSMAVLSGARLSGEAANRAQTRGEAPAQISSRFFCPRPPLLLCTPNQNGAATQAITA